MNDSQYLQHCLHSWQHFADTFVQRTQALDEEAPLRLLALGCQQAGNNAHTLHDEGALLVTRLFTHFPEFAPTFPRALLWFLGSDCLHYLTDEEIILYQQLDKAREQAAERGEIIDFDAARTRLQAASGN
ncbi:MAG: PA2817 family protein [Parahaliea sp.]